MVSPAIPIIDFAHFPVNEEAIGAQLYTACREVGFAYLVNAFPDERVAEMFEWSKKFFALSDADKNKAPHPPEGWKHRGFSPVGREHIANVDVRSPVFCHSLLERVIPGGCQDFYINKVVNGTTKETPEEIANRPDWKESFDFGTEGGPVLENVWPPEDVLPGFRQVAVRFYNDIRATQLIVLRALAIGFPGLDPEFFEKCHENGDKQLRLLRYPGAAASAFKGVERCAPHSDFGTCTFLFQDAVGGLEIEDPNHPGVFIPATPIPGHIIFNLGDFLRHISNDTLQSTLHRVRAPTQDPNDMGMTQDRYSMAYFCGGDRDKVIDVLPGSYGPDNPRKYEPISVSKYIDMRMNALYASVPESQ